MCAGWTTPVRHRTSGRRKQVPESSHHAHPCHQVAPKRAQSRTVGGGAAALCPWNPHLPRDHFQCWGAPGCASGRGSHPSAHLPALTTVLSCWGSRKAWTRPSWWPWTGCLSTPSRPGPGEPGTVGWVREATRLHLQVSIWGQECTGREAVGRTGPVPKRGRCVGTAGRQPREEPSQPAE